jgi:protein-disulfide isomerase
VIEEYADYQCPYCGMVATLTVPQIIETYVETGKARFVFFDFPLNPGASQLGAEAARCAGDQGAFWAMHKVLMGRMREWGSRRNPRSAFREYAEALGIDGKALVECVDTRKHREVVLAGQTRGRQLGLTGTPTFIINGRRVGSTMGFDQMAALIEEELAKQ